MKVFALVVALSTLVALSTAHPHREPNVREGLNEELKVVKTELEAIQSSLEAGDVGKAQPDDAPTQWCYNEVDANGLNSFCKGYFIATAENVCTYQPSPPSHTSLQAERICNALGAECVPTEGSQACQSSRCKMAIHLNSINP